MGISLDHPLFDRLTDVGRLTAREREVFGLLWDGSSNVQIARRMGITERTVRAHLGQIMSKLDLRGRVPAAVASFVYAMQLDDGGGRADLGMLAGPVANTGESDNGKKFAPEIVS